MTDVATTLADTRPTVGAVMRARPSARRVAAAAALAGLLMGGCADDVGDEADRPLTGASADDTEASSDDSPAPPTSTDGATEPAPEPTASASQQTEPSSAGTALPGQPFDDLYVDDGDVLGVVGVAHDDVLNVRGLPSADAPIVTTAQPTQYGLVATGRSRLVDGPTVWHEVDVGDVTGWVSTRFVSFIGPTRDETSRLVDRHGNLRGDTMEALGREVASHYEATDDVVSRVVMSVPPSLGDIAEVTYDVVELPDDSAFGYRLHVFAEPDESGEGFTLVTLEVTDLCSRGGTPDGDDPCP